MRANAIITTDNKKRTVYCCKICGCKKYLKETYDEHIAKCLNDFKNSNSILNIDYVECNLCGFIGKSISTHLRQSHNLTKDNYSGNVVCEKTNKIYSKSNSETGKNYWASLTDEERIKVNEKNSQSVRAALKNNPKESERRSKLMTELNATVMKSPEVRKKLSDVAKRTSKRPDILEKRSKQLQNWRDNYPDQFLEKCTNKLLQWKLENPDKVQENIIEFVNSFKSKAEKELKIFLRTLDNFNFKNNQFISDDSFISKTKRKQVDFIDYKKNIFIEYDGQFHFENKMNPDRLVIQRSIDKLFDKYIIDNNLILIRISFDQFRYGSKPHFIQTCLDQLISILNNPSPGIFWIGTAYDKYS
jgi:hypothetical protein